MAEERRTEDDDLRAMLDAAITGLVLLDRDGSIIYCNRSVQRWLGTDKVATLADLRCGADAYTTVSGAICEFAPAEVETAMQATSGRIDILMTGRPLGLGDGREGYLLEIVNITAISQRESRLRMLLLRDSLTGVASRRHFFELGERALADSRRYGAPLTVGMLDIDHFKRVNDVCGHSVGDLVLTVVASCCTVELRRNDVIGRLGGDEFGLLMPSTPAGTARGVADRLRERVGLAMHDASVSRVNVTVSIGLAAANEDDSMLETVLSRADQALYLAKGSGRDRTAVFGMS